jgi:hypothetical protein
MWHFSYRFLLLFLLLVGCTGADSQGNVSTSEEQIEQTTLETARTVVADMPTLTPDPSTPILAETPRIDDQSSSGFSLLEIEDVSYDGGAVRITGATDLPDGSILDVTFDIAEYSSPNDPYVGISTQVEVRNGQFLASLQPPNIPEYQEGPYEVEVRFRPQSGFGPFQPENVTDQVGLDGENLVGQNVQELQIGIKVLVDTLIVDLLLNIQPPEYPQLDLSSYPADAPERALAEYLVAWQNLDWERMAQFAQKTWKDGLANPAEDLMYQYDFKTLLGAELGEIEEVSEGTMVRITAKLYYSVRPTEVRVVIIHAMVIRETGPYQPSEQGDWGVNPISTYEEELVEE